MRSAPARSIRSSPEWQSAAGCCKVDPDGGLRARKEYSLTKKGQEVLAFIRHQVEELYREVVLGEEEEHEK